MKHEQKYKIIIFKIKKQNLKLLFMSELIKNISVKPHELFFNNAIELDKWYEYYIQNGNLN